MGQLSSRRSRPADSEDDVAASNYKYYPKIGSYFGSTFMMGGERFESVQPEAFLFGENNDLNFLEPSPVDFPYPSPSPNEPMKSLQSFVHVRRDSLRFVPIQKYTEHMAAESTGSPLLEKYPNTVTPSDGVSGISSAAGTPEGLANDKDCGSKAFEVAGESMMGSFDIGGDVVGEMEGDLSPSSSEAGNGTSAVPEQQLVVESKPIDLRGNIEFTFDSDLPCFITVYFFAMEQNDHKLGANYLSKCPELCSKTYHYDMGANQQFTQSDLVFDLAMYKPAELLYDPDTGVIPVVIHCVVDEATETGYPQSHATLAFIEPSSDTIGFALKPLKQKLFVDGICFLLQEIYGIENKHEKADEFSAAEDYDDGNSECVVCMSELRDTLILPCRHLCLCYAPCAETLRYKASNCPICRSPFRALLRIKAFKKTKAPAVLNTISESAPNLALPPATEHYSSSTSSSFHNIVSSIEPVHLMDALNGPGDHHHRTGSLPRNPIPAIPQVLCRQKTPPRAPPRGRQKKKSGRTVSPIQEVLTPSVFQSSLSEPPRSQSAYFQVDLAAGGSDDLEDPDGYDRPVNLNLPPVSFLPGGSGLHGRSSVTIVPPVSSDQRIAKNLEDGSTASYNACHNNHNASKKVFLGSSGPRNPERTEPEAQSSSFAPKGKHLNHTRKLGDADDPRTRSKRGGRKAASSGTGGGRSHPLFPSSHSAGDYSNNCEGSLNAAGSGISGNEPNNSLDEEYESAKLNRMHRDYPSKFPKIDIKDSGSLEELELEAASCRLPESELVNEDGKTIRNVNGFIPIANAQDLASKSYRDTKQLSIPQARNGKSVVSDHLIKNSSVSDGKMTYENCSKLSNDAYHYDSVLSPLESELVAEPRNNLATVPSNCESICATAGGAVDFPHVVDLESEGSRDFPELAGDALEDNLRGDNDHRFYLGNEHNDENSGLGLATNDDLTEGSIATDDHRVIYHNVKLSAGGASVEDDEIGHFRNSLNEVESPLVLCKSINRNVLIVEGLQDQSLNLCSSDRENNYNLKSDLVVGELAVGRKMDHVIASSDNTDISNSHIQSVQNAGLSGNGSRALGIEEIAGVPTSNASCYPCAISSDGNARRSDTPVSIQSRSSVSSTKPLLPNSSGDNMDGFTAGGMENEDVAKPFNCSESDVDMHHHHHVRRV